MTNVVIDLSNMVFRSMFVVGGFGAKSFTFDTQYEVDQLMRKISTDVSYIIRQVNGSRVIFALDSKSWRKSIAIDENDGYKANRDKNGAVNWENVFNALNEFGSIMHENGFIVSKIDNAEADDIISLWRDELLVNQGQHVVIVSSDEDVRQLVGSFPTEDKLSFCVVFNPFAVGKPATKKVFVPAQFEEWLNTNDEGDIFNRSIDVDKEDFRRLRDSDKITVETIDGPSIALRKVFCGDDGDNIPSIYSWLGTNGKVVRITESKFQKIVSSINAKSYMDIMPNRDKVFEHLTTIAGHTPSINIKDRIERQLKLVVLDRSMFPKDIVEKFDAHIIDELKRPYIQAQKYNMNTMLSGTRYVRSKPGTESSIFREFDTLNSKLY